MIEAVEMSSQASYHSHGDAITLLCVHVTATVTL